MHNYALVTENWAYLGNGAPRTKGDRRPRF